jgi:ankyrin repeat protein
MGDHCDLSQLEEYTTALMSLRSVAEELLKSGAKINAVTVSGRTPLHEMFCKGSDIIYDTCMTESREKTSLRRSLDKVKSLLVRSLLQWGANPMIVDRHGYSALHYCARENMYDAMVEILKNTPSLDINVCSSRGRTPLHVACMSSSAEVATLLCKWDADLKYGILYCQDKSGKLPQDLLGVGIDAISLLTLWKACRSGMPDK